MSETSIAFMIVAIYFSPVFYHLIIAIKESKRKNPIPLRKFINVLKYSGIVFILLFIGFAVISHTNYLNYEKPMRYDKIDQITFENFRGLEFFKKTLYGNERMAYVVTSIESKIDENSVTVESLFYPSRSYVYNSQTSSKELLSHEKYHIKITELYARKAKERISKLDDFSIIKINRIIDQINLEENTHQKRYDYDTFHSYVLSEQKKHEREIDSLLYLLSEFKNPKIIFNDKT